MAFWALGRNRWVPTGLTVGPISAGIWGHTHQELLSRPGCVVWGLCGCDQFYSMCLSVVLSFSRFLQGVTWLADISLHDPVSISVLDESHDQSNPKSKAIPEASPQAGDELDSFAIPASLEQYVTVVPSKLRLVSLAGFILQKCKVGLGTGSSLTRGKTTVLFMLGIEAVS